ncbi:MAG: NPXTG-anchored protein [Oscillospiraceae bacterium]
MKLRKLIAAAAATVMGASVLAATASAYEAFLMYTDNSWLWGCWKAEEFPAGTVDITEDGTYTVYIDSSIPTALVEDEETGELVPYTATGTQVFCVDIDGLAKAKNCGADAEGYEDCETGADKMAFAKNAGINVSNVIVTTTSSDGTVKDVPVNQDNIIFGDIEANGKIRIEISNAYGDTSKAPAVNADDISFDEKIAVTFTITGVAEPSAVVDEPTDNGAVDTDAPTNDNKGGSPDTGVEGVAAVAGLAVLAAGAALVSKKRK